MTSHNLGTAVGPTVFPGLAISKCALVLEYVVSHYHEIFRNLESEVGSSSESSSAASSLSASVGAADDRDRLSRLNAILGASSLTGAPSTGGGLLRF